MNDTNSLSHTKRNRKYQIVSVQSILRGEIWRHRKKAEAVMQMSYRSTFAGEKLFCVCQS